MELFVGKSLNGHGIFTNHLFKARQTIFVVQGSIISSSEIEKYDEKFINNLYRFDKNLYINPSGLLGDYLNHSCIPNAGIIKKQNRLHVVALFDIHAKFEVVMDYSSILAVDDDWTMQCNCKSIHCRNVIQKFQTLSIYLQIKYIELGIVPDYIQG